MTPMTPEQAARFDQAISHADQAAALSLHGYHAEAARCWLEAAKQAVTVSGKQACIANAQWEWSFVGVRKETVQ